MDIRYVFRTAAGLPPPEDLAITLTSNSASDIPPAAPGDIRALFRPQSRTAAGPPPLEGEDLIPCTSVGAPTIAAAAPTEPAAITAAAAPAAPAKVAREDCCICSETVDGSNAFPMSCSHTVCTECGIADAASTSTDGSRCPVCKEPTAYTGACSAYHPAVEEDETQILWNADGTHHTEEDARQLVGEEDARQLVGEVAEHTMLRARRAAEHATRRLNVLDQRVQRARPTCPVTHELVEGPNGEQVALEYRTAEEREVQIAAYLDATTAARAFGTFSD